MTVVLTRAPNVRRFSWAAVILSLGSLVGGLIGVASGIAIHAETLLMPCAVLIASSYATQPNVTPRRAVLLAAVSAMLTAVGLAFMALRAAG